VDEGRVSAIDEMLAPDGLIHGLGADMHGSAEFKQFHAAYRGAFPDIWIQVDDLVAEGDMVAARWSGGGTHGGAGLGLAQTNRAVTFQGMTFARVRDGRIVEGWNSFDELGLLKQIGAVDVKLAG
jgi:predicted ester cyclase